MNNKENKKIIKEFLKKLPFKKKIFFYFYKSKQYLYNKLCSIKILSKKNSYSFSLYFIFFGILIFLLNRNSIYPNSTISEYNLYNLAFAIAGIIGLSISIIFSFSNSNLQKSSDLFSNQYLKKFINNPKEKIFFWFLFILIVVSFLVPIILRKYQLEALYVILFESFLILFTLYEESRKIIDPEITLKKIKEDAIKKLERTSKELKKYAHIQNKIFEYKKEFKKFSLDAQYKANSNWHLTILENVKYLFEIGLRLLAKNEISSFNLTIRYIYDIYLKHLDLRNGYFVRIPTFWGVSSYDDEGFTIRILEYFQSISDRIIQEKRKENIYFLLKIYESILAYSLKIEYDDKNLNNSKENPLFNIILAYYIGFIESLLKSKENDWIWKSIKSVSNVSNFVSQENDNYLIHSKIGETINKIFKYCLENNKEEFFGGILKIFFNQIKIIWNKYEYNNIFWGHLFGEIKKKITLLSLIGKNNLSISLAISELFINFHTWQGIITNWILEIKEEKEQKENLDKFIILLKKWSDFLLDIARDEGLNNKLIGLPIIQSVDNNLKVIYAIKNNFKDIELEKIYQDQFYVFSWYFQKTNEVEDSFLFNLEQILEILIREINYNLKDKIFDIKYLIDLYVELIEQHFKKTTLGYGYNHPRIIEKLIYLGLILNKYKMNEQEKNIIEKIEELNKRYLELNKEYFKIKEEKENLMGPDKFQLCKEIHNLKNDLFSYTRDTLMGIKYILKEEITEKEWDNFINKLEYCKGIEYTTENFF